MRVPFPNIDSNLAVRSHMYICLKQGSRKEFVKCQTFKPNHLIKSKPPFNYLIESSDINRNPFSNKTTIDCDKSFSIEDVVIDKSLLTTRRKDVCDDLFDGIMESIKHDSFLAESIDVASFISLNHKVKSKVH